MRVWLCRVLRKGNTLVRITRIQTEQIAAEIKAFERLMSMKACLVGFITLESLVVRLSL